jgi:hypothetical protein
LKAVDHPLLLQRHFEPFRQFSGDFHRNPGTASRFAGEGQRVGVRAERERAALADRLE